MSDQREFEAPYVYDCGRIKSKSWNSPKVRFADYSGLDRPCVNTEGSNVMRHYGQAGLMFELSASTFVGSYFFFISASRP
jgi:hypothetical protein